MLWSSVASHRAVTVCLSLFLVGLCERHVTRRFNLPVFGVRHQNRHSEYLRRSVLPARSPDHYRETGLMWDLQKLFVKHAREIDRFLRRRGHSPEAAADLTQDTFLRVLASPPAEPAGNYNPRAYLYRVSRNLSINHMRREKLIQSVDPQGEELSTVADTSPTAEAVIYSRQCLTQVEQALAELPDRTRRAFVLNRLGERTIAEVADELGLSTTRTWTLIHDAYRHLLTQVDDF